MDNGFVGFMFMFLIVYMFISEGNLNKKIDNLESAIKAIPTSCK